MPGQTPPDPQDDRKDTQARHLPTPRMTARVIPTILRRGFTRAKCDTCPGGMSLAVILEMVSYCLCWCEWAKDVNANVILNVLLSAC